MSDVLPSDEGRTYDAFVSYSHAADKPLADAIQRGLHRFAKPWYKLRALRVFRDDTSLSANPALWGSIEKALSESSWFILFASEPAANSEWVSREVATWCAKHATERVLIVQTDGEIEWDRDRGDFDWDRTTALPRIMDGRFGEEPRHIDMRWARHGQELDPRDPRLRDSVAELAAPLHGLPKDDLYGEDHRQHRRARRMARGAVSVLMALLVALGFTTVFAVDQRNEATQQRDRALARQLAAQADALRDTRLDRSLLLALHSLKFADTVQGRDALLGSLQAGPLIERFLDRPTTTSAQAVFNSGGDLLALQSSRGGDVFIEIWDSAGLEPVTEIVEDEAFGFVGAHAFSGGSGIIAVGWSNGATRLYDVQSGEPLTEPFGAGADTDARGLDADEQVARVVNALAFDSQGDRLVTGDGSGRIVEWDVVGDEPRRLNSVQVEALDTGVSGAAYLDDGQVIATGIGATVIWDPLERHEPPLGRLEPEPSPILSLNGSGPAVAADGRTVVAGGSLAGSDIEAETTADPGVLVFWDTEGSESVPTGLPDPVSAIASSHDGEVLAVGDSGGNVSFWSARLRQRVDGPFHVHGARIDYLAFAPGDGTLVTSADDGQVALLGIDVSQPSFGVRPRDRRLVEDSEESVFLPDALDVDASPDGDRLAVGLDSGDVVVWSPDRAQVVDRLEGEGRPATAVLFLDDETVLVGSDTGSVRRWRLGESRAEDLGLGINDGLVSMAVSPDRSLVAVGTTGSFGVFELATGGPVVGPVDVESGVEDVSFFPDGSAVAATHGDAVARWTIADEGTQEPVTVSVGHGGAFAVAVDPTGAVVAVGLWDGHMSFVDAASWKPIGEAIPAHGDDRVTAVTWTPDGTHLVTGAGDRRVRVWDGATRVILGSSFDQTSIVTALAPLPSGRVAVADRGGQIQLWDVAVSAWRREACLIVGRELTAAEFDQLIGPDLGVRRVCGDD